MLGRFQRPWQMVLDLTQKTQICGSKYVQVEKINSGEKQKQTRLVRVPFKAFACRALPYLFKHREKGACFCIQMGWKKNNLKPMWEMLMKQVDLGEPTTLLDQENLGGVRNVNTSQI